MTHETKLTDDIMHEYKKNLGRLRVLQDKQLGKLYPEVTQEQKDIENYIDTVDFILSLLNEQKQKIIRYWYINNYSVAKISMLLNYSYEYTSLLKVKACCDFAEIVTHIPDKKNDNVRKIYDYIKKVQSELQ